ncbi:VacJ family lipoprotein [Sphingobium fluviale]|uniref:VacJ family lipoprotein n=2 Tax=Sphingobium fluviale TaxID=2506423 RepID=A0A4Q1KII3_9SPHN|nr:VacJ family lipoprotein [Sphingobium fluviale]
MMAPARADTSIGGPPPVVPAPPQATAPAPPTSPEGQDVITVSAERGAPKEDPAQAVNQLSYEAVQAIDKAVIGPVAREYKESVPKKMRKSVRNVINNLDEPIVFVNFLLQFKVGKAAETLARFGLNSTVGLAGVMDVAKKKPFNLPRRSNGLADTLGYYGVGPGPYLFLPLIGSTTVRDVFGRMLDLSLVPVVAGKPFNTPYYALPKGGLSALDERAEFDDELKEIRESGNPYAAQRTYYLNKRKAEILALHSEEYRIRKMAEEAAKQAADAAAAASRNEGGVSAPSAPAAPAPAAAEPAPPALPAPAPQPTQP